MLGGNSREQSTFFRYLLSLSEALQRPVQERSADRRTGYRAQETAAILSEVATRKSALLGTALPVCGPAAVTKPAPTPVKLSLLAIAWPIFIEQTLRILIRPVATFLVSPISD